MRCKKDGQRKIQIKYIVGKQYFIIKKWQYIYIYLYLQGYNKLNYNTGIIMMFKTIIQKLLVILVLAIVGSSRKVSFMNKHLSSYVIVNQWNEIQKMVSGQPITELQFEEGLICAEAIDRLLNHNNIKNSLQSLRFNTTAFNNEIFATFWNCSVVRQLQTLILDLCTIENMDLKLMANSSMPNLQVLSLNGNFITQEGFGYLSQVAMPKIKTLCIHGNSLITNQSIESLMKLNLSNWEHINIGYTGLSSQNAYKLISSLNTQKLKTLNISTNTFSSEFYKNMSQLNFSSLEVLAMEDMLIDQNMVPYLKQMRFPSLTTLSIGRNWLFTNRLYTFLNPNNYPNLNYLIINSTLFEDDFLQYLATQFTNTKFVGLQLSGQGITSKGFKHLLVFNTQNIRSLTIERGMIQPTLMLRLIKEKQYQNLQQLNIEYLLNAGNTFSTIIEHSWPKLKKLKMPRIGKIDIIKLREINRIIFPSLQFLVIDARELSKSEIKQVVYFLAKVCYHKLHLQLAVTEYESIVMDIAEKAYINIPNIIALQLKKLQQQYINIDYLKVLSIALMPQKQPIIKYMDYSTFLQDIYKTNYIDPEIDKEEANAISSKILENLDFTNSERFSDSNNLTLLSHIVSLKKKQNLTCILPSTEVLVILNLHALGFEVLKQCQFPNLKALTLQFNSSFQTNWSDFKIFHQSFRQILRLYLQIPSAPNSQIITSAFEQQKFDLLRQLRLAKCNIYSQQLRNIFKSNRNLNRIKLMYFESLKINKNLTFLYELDFHLRALVFVHELVGEVVQQISTMNFQFIEVFHLFSVGLKNEKFIAFLEKVKERGGSFPKLKDVRLGANMIESEGANKFFEFGIPLLQNFEMVLNKDPNQLNDIFGSSSTGRLKGFVLYRNSEDSIDHNLNPNSTRSLSKLVVQTGSLHQTDYSKLAKMDFRFATDFVLIINRYFQCETFLDLANITANSKTLYLYIEKQVQNANSHCFVPNANRTNYAFLTRLIIRVGNYYFSNLRNFSHAFFQQPKLMESLQLQGVYPSIQDFNALGTMMNLDYLAIIDLEANDLQDQMVRQLLKANFAQLKGLSLKGNARITSNAISGMRNKAYPALEVLVLSETVIDDMGLETLSTCSFPKLQKLGLSNTQITGKGLAYLSQLNAPLLSTLDLSNNLFQSNQLKSLKVSNFKYLKTILYYPYIYDKDLEQLTNLFNQNRNQRRKIQFVTDVIHFENREALNV